MFFFLFSPHLAFKIFHSPEYNQRKIESFKLRKLRGSARLIRLNQEIEETLSRWTLLPPHIFLPTRLLSSHHRAQLQLAAFLLKPHLTLPRSVEEYGLTET